MVALPEHNDEEDDVFIDPRDVDAEFVLDEEDLPDAEDEKDEPDNSIHVFRGHSDPVFSVACSPLSSTLVATGGGDDKIFLWNIGDVSAPRELTGHTDSVSVLHFSQSGLLLASGGVDGVVQIWDVSGSLKHKLEGPGDEIEFLCWHPRGNVVLAGSRDYTAWMWNADSGVCLTVFTGHGASVTCGGFTPDGKLVCTASADWSLRVWNPKTGECIRCVQGHPYHSAPIVCFAVSNDSNLAITGADDGTACLVNVQTGRVLGTLSGHEKSIECTALSPSLPLVATGGMDEKLIIWDLQTLSARFTCEHEDGIVKLLWTSSELIVTGCLDGKVRIWDPRSGTCRSTFYGHEDSILDLAITCDGHCVVSTSDDETTRVFELSV